MRLEACPLCTLVGKANDEDRKEFCCRIKFGEQKAVVLLHHDAVPSKNAMDEALEQIGPFRGTVQEISQAPGHWGIVVSAGDWSEAVGKSKARGE